MTVHGRAVAVDLAEAPGFRRVLLDVYVPRYGEKQWLRLIEDTSPVYARIEADRMFTFSTPRDSPRPKRGIIARRQPRSARSRR